MRVLVGCEYSGTVRDAFIARGHDAVSCDLLPTERPGPHYQGSVLDLLGGQHWDLGIFHPPCTYLTSAGLFRNAGNPERQAMTEEALQFVRLLLDAGIERIALENPVGRIGTAVRKSSQTIQPYDFGEDASKATCLWLKNLPLLVADPSNRYPGRWVIDPRNGKTVERWSNQTDSGQNNLPPSKDRWKDRSRTYQGIADAMADQWGGGTVQSVALHAAPVVRQEAQYSMQF
ncbi:MAG: hypothetical protein PSX71_14010 [bacterium]|nr:hypothetical protein [bacterium]